MFTFRYHKADPNFSEVSLWALLTKSGSFFVTRAVQPFTSNRGFLRGL